MTLPSLNKLSPHMQEIARGASIAFILQTTAVGLSFVFNVILARLLGAEGAGMYFLALTVTTIAAVFGRVGLDNSLLRFVAANAAIGNWKAVKGVYQKGIRFALFTSASTTLIVILIAPWLATTVFSEPELTVSIRWMALAIVPTALFTLYAQLLKGLKRIRDSVSVQSFWLPAFSVLGVIVLTPIWGLQGAVLTYMLAATVTLLIGLWWWFQATPQLRGLTQQFSTAQLISSSMPLFWMSTFQLVILWSSTFMLGIWKSNEEVGIFGVANRTALLITLILVAVNSIAAPKFAALHSQGDIGSLENTARGSAKLMALLASPILILFVLMPGWVMGLFGEQFTSGLTALQILSVGQYINVVTGSVGFLLMMCGYEHLMRNNMALCAIIIVVLNVLLIPPFGVTGAAVASAVTLVLQNLIAAGHVWKQLGIWTIPLFKIGRK